MEKSKKTRTLMYCCIALIIFIVFMAYTVPVIFLILVILVIFFLIDLFLDLRKEGKKEEK